MRFSEFGILREETESDPVLADLITFISQEAAEFQDIPDVDPEVSMDALINAMENLGHAGFSASTLEDYFNDKDSGLQNLISAISDDVVTLATGEARMPDDSEAPVRPPEEVVGSMAQRAARRSES
jgi:hypothetical protein